MTSRMPSSKLHGSNAFIPLLVFSLTLLACAESPSRHPSDAKSDRDTIVRDLPAHDRGDTTSDLTNPPHDGTAPSDTTPPHDSDTATHTCATPDPAWLFCDDFEKMAQGFDAWYAASGWTDQIGKGDAGRMTSSTDAHGGKFAVYYPAAASAGYQGADLIWRACAGTNKAGCKPLLGYDTLYFRTWVKLAPDHQMVHHFLGIKGGPLDDYWAPYGNAGCRPNGKRHMGTTVDFKKTTHRTFFYTYFPAMKCDPGSHCSQYADPAAICAGCANKDMPCDNGLECCWGNSFAPPTDVNLPLGKWFCFEMMMKANDVGKKNGEMAYWIDGKLGHEVKQMQWRDTDTLKLNMVRLQHYVTTGDAKGHSNRVWFDDVVISTKRIGCK